MVSKCEVCLARDLNVAVDEGLYIGLVLRGGIGGVCKQIPRNNGKGKVLLRMEFIELCECVVDVAIYIAEYDTTSYQPASCTCAWGVRLDDALVGCLHF
jgi:hypothetical protein